jgi:hypothetical protein
MDDLRERRRSCRRQVVDPVAKPQRLRPRSPLGTYTARTMPPPAFTPPLPLHTDRARVSPRSPRRRRAPPVRRGAAVRATAAAAAAAGPQPSSLAVEVRHPRLRAPHRATGAL